MNTFFRRLTPIWLACLLVGRCLTFAAQEIPVPIDLQYQLLLKILDFDRNLKTRVGEEIVFGIAYQKTFRESADTKDELVKAIQRSSLKEINGLPISYVLVELKGENDLADALAKEKINILYITPLRAFDIRAFANVCQAKQIMTLTGVPAYINLGISIGFEVKGQSPEIVINLQSAKAEGTDFSSRLLQLARVIE